MVAKTYKIKITLTMIEKELEYVQNNQQRKKSI